MTIRTTVLSALSLLFSTIPAVLAQTTTPRGPAITGPEGMRLTSRFRAARVSSASFSNSPRTYELIRAGNMYLSLQDAIALALENNLDIQLQRYNVPIAGTDVLRSRGGGLPRGLVYTVRELPQGIGGPGGPLLTTLGASSTVSQLSASSADLAVINQQETNLAVQSTIPFSVGSPVPLFDPLLNIGINDYHHSQPQNNTVSTGTSNLVTNQVSASGGYQQAFSTGTAFNLLYQSNRFDTNSLRSNYNPYTAAALGLTVSQPLLQGFGIDVNRRFIKISANEQKIANLIFDQQLITTVSSVIRLYWDLVSLRGDVGVKQQALTTAQKLYEDNQQQVEVGTLAPLQLKRAAAEVARAKQDLINSQSLVEQQEVILKNVLTRTGTADASLANVHIITLDRIDIPAEDQVPPMSELADQAIRNRPDLMQAQIEIQNAGLSLKGSRNELLPQLNIVAGVTNNALAGNINPDARGSLGLPITPDPFLVGGSGTVLSQIFRRNYPDYGIGFQLNIPLGNRIARADAARDQLMLRQSEVRLKEVENQIRVEVENALVTLRRARASYDAAVQTRQLQEEALDAEQQRLSVGQSTSFFVIQYERDLAQARSTEVIALGDYAKARAALDRAIGRTLDANNISLEEAEKGVVTRAPSAIPNNVQ